MSYSVLKATLKNVAVYHPISMSSVDFTLSPPGHWAFATLYHLNSMGSIQLGLFLLGHTTDQSTVTITVLTATIVYFFGMNRLCDNTYIYRTCPRSPL